MRRRSARRPDCILMLGVRWASCVGVNVRVSCMLVECAWVSRHPACMCASRVRASRVPRGIRHVRGVKPLEGEGPRVVEARVCMSVMGVGEDMRAGQRAALGSEAVSKRKNISWQLHT